jgi:hypothetical protein
MYRGHAVTVVALDENLNPAVEVLIAAVTGHCERRYYVGATLPDVARA